jgi:hypothetical protein
MAGYRKQRTVYDLTFADHDGLEVMVAGLTTGQTMEMWEAKADSGPEATGKMLRMFADSLLGWNLETEEGDPVPQDLEGVKSQELPFVLEIIEAWTTALTGADAELGKDSTSGDPSLEAAIPMEPL